jgi:hypothetical protein
VFTFFPFWGGQVSENPLRSYPPLDPPSHIFRKEKGPEKRAELSDNTVEVSAFFLFFQSK